MCDQALGFDLVGETDVDKLEKCKKMLQVAVEHNQNLVLTCHDLRVDLSMAYHRIEEYERQVAALGGE